MNDHENFNPVNPTRNVAAQSNILFEVLHQYDEQ